MNDLIWIILDVVCLIAFVYFIHCEKENTKARKEQIIELKKQNKILDESDRSREEQIAELKKYNKMLDEVLRRRLNE